MHASGWMGDYCPSSCVSLSGVSSSPLSSESVGERMGMERVLCYDLFVINVMTMTMIIIVIKLLHA